MLSVQTARAEFEVPKSTAQKSRDFFVEDVLLMGAVLFTKTRNSMDQDKISLASEQLWQSWQQGLVIEQIDASARPTSRLDAYAVQAMLEAKSKKPLFGWKIAATSIAGQKHIGVDGPLAGRLLAERVLSNGAAISLLNNRMKVAECEFAFEMKRSLQPKSQAYSLDEVMAAVGALHPAIEIPDSRFARFETVGAPSLIADNACTNFVMIGQAATCNWRAMNLAQHSVTASVANAQGLKHHHGVGSNVLGDPRIALTWLVNELSSMGIALAEDQIVITGTCIVPIAVTSGDSVDVNFGPIGSVNAVFVD
jgi:2-keto-4-pentenoate hydratase